MKVLVCGSRTWPSYVEIRRRLALMPPDTLVIHGGARGADAMADTAARAVFSTEPRVYRADWERYGKKAGFKRNIQMVESKPDLVLAFILNASRGASHTVRAAKKRGIPTEVHMMRITNGRYLGMWTETEGFVPVALRLRPSLPEGYSYL